MTRNIAATAHYIAHKTAEHSWPVRTGALVLSLGLAACATGGGTSNTGENPSARAGTSAMAGPNTASAVPRVSLPDVWPARITMPVPDCREGAPIVHQPPHKIGSLLAFYVDGQCNFGPGSKPTDPVGLYHSPEFTPPGTAPYKADNGETFIEQCRNPNGQKTGDERGFESYSTEWVYGTINNASTGEQPQLAWVSAVNLGQAALGQVSEC